MKSIRSFCYVVEYVKFVYGEFYILCIFDGQYIRYFVNDFNGSKQFI